MESSQLKKINNKIQELHDAMSVVLPLENLIEHPFEHFRSVTDKVILSIDSTIEEMKKRKSEVQNEINNAVACLRKTASELELVEPFVPDLHNIFMTWEYVRNEMNRLMTIRKSVKSRMLVLIEDIEGVRDRLGNTDVTMQEIDTDMDLKIDETNDEVSLGRLRRLEVYRNNLKNEEQRRESSRDRLYADTKDFLSKMSKRDDDVRIDQKILVLEELHRKYKDELDDRLSNYKRLERNIRRKERCLDLPFREIDVSLGDDNMSLLSKYDLYLDEEQKRLLGEIYQRYLTIIRDLSGLFGLEMKEYRAVEEDVEEMRRVIEMLEPKKELFLTITSLISKRSELIDKMNEFEKIASDPKRLFKSSFQLLSEEKFRNNAFPNLMKIEETIFQNIEEYEGQFGKFRKDGINYKEVLQSEIENRIVNKTVFISKFDSPARKRRNC